jgi:serine 3-dehydrogenase
MVRRGRGHVVNLGSTAGHWVYPGGAVYCASKHAVRALTEGMRMDVHGSGVRVTSVDPGLVGGTEFSDVRFRGDHERARKVYEGVQPLTPEDIAETILWCVERPAHVNVQEIILMPVAQASVTMVKRT